jgi:hypothetical protein
VVGTCEAMDPEDPDESHFHAMVEANFDPEWEMGVDPYLPSSYLSTREHGVTVTEDGNVAVVLRFEPDFVPFIRDVIMGHLEDHGVCHGTIAAGLVVLRAVADELAKVEGMFDELDLEQYSHDDHDDE